MDEKQDRILTRVELSVGLPTPEELQRIVDAFLDANPISTAYGVITGDVGVELPVENQDRILQWAAGILWLRAARKRLDKPE